MSATSLQVITICFANPEWQAGDNEFQQINSTISFSYLESYHLTTLSTNNANAGTAVTGLLYVPDLKPGDPCIDASAPYIAPNVTRQKNLPEVNYELVALAPWISPKCTLNYLESARKDPIRGFLFYLPDNSTSVPSADDGHTWDLGDSEHWKRENHFPVYAIPGAGGMSLMAASALYSGNMTDVPNGHLLSEYYDVRDYVRLFADIDTGGGSTLPSLWIFLLVVLGILLAIIGLTSLAMHWLQRRRRQALRRRVANGEVDLEALGIKRLTVPQKVLDQMPLYTYGSGTPVAPSSLARERSRARTAKLDESPHSTRPSSPSSNDQPIPVSTLSAHHHPTRLEQPTCPICLDDFIPASRTGGTGTIVRELPCEHIFHPECVDTFLRDNSSLCPMCKKTSLPKGYCPRVVTNAMVRRERMIRRIRPQATAEEGEVQPDEIPSFTSTETERRSRMGRFGSFRPPAWRHHTDGGRRIFSAPTSRATASQQMTEMSPALIRSHTTNSSPSRQRSTTNAPPIQPPSNPSRREWARQRAVAMLGRRQAPIDPDAEEAERTPGWRKAVRGLFPGR